MLDEMYGTHGLPALFRTWADRVEQAKLVFLTVPGLEAEAAITTLRRVHMQMADEARAIEANLAREMARR